MHRAAALLCLLLAASGAHAQDLVLKDGAIYTLDAKRPWASVIAIHDGRIAFVGEYGETALTPYLKDARIIDLHGAMVLPGFHDSHMHLLSGGLRLIQCDLGPAKTLQDAEAIIRADAAVRPAHPWIFCNNISTLVMARLSLKQLDALVPD